MNAKQLIAAVAVLAAAGSALADDTGAYVDFTNVVSTKSRAEVVAELKQAQSEGSYVLGGEEYPNQFAASTYSVRPYVAAPVASGKSRAQVIAELKQAQADGSYVVGGEEFAGQAPVLARNSRTGTQSIESAQHKKPAAGAIGG